MFASTPLRQFYNIDAFRGEIESSPLSTVTTGLSTGLPILDNFFLWRGIPIGEISLFRGEIGAGATSLWLKVAGLLPHKNKLAAWVSSHLQLNKQHSFVTNVHALPDQQSLYEVVCRSIESKTYALIGCHLSKIAFSNEQLKKLRDLVNQHQVALVFITETQDNVFPSTIPLIVECHHDFFTVQRATQRPTPFTIDTPIQTSYRNHLAGGRA